MATDLITIATTAVLSQFLGPSAKHLGEMVLERGKQVGSKAMSYLAAVGREPQSVEPKILLPLVQAASLESDPMLTELWAALLANTADPAQKVQVQPAYVEILRQLLPADTQVLTRLYFPPGPPGRGISAVDGVIDSEIFRAMGYHDGRLTFDNLVRLRLCREGELDMERKGRLMWSTELGLRFMQAVTPPALEGDK